MLAVNDGPSLDEYDLDELRNCGAKLYGYGRVAALFDFDKFFMGDLRYIPLLANMKPTEVYAELHNLEKQNDNWPKQHMYLRTASGAINTPAMEAVIEGHRKVFMIGNDSYFFNDRTRRPKYYSEAIPKIVHEEWSQWYGHERSVGTKLIYQKPSLDQSDNYSIAYLNMRDCCWQLSLDSYYSVSVPVHPEVLSQPFGHISRTKPAVTVNLEKKVGWWPTFPVETQVDYIKALREKLPGQAIFVRAADHAHVKLARMTPDDIQIGNLNCKVAPNLFAHVTDTWLSDTCYEPQSKLFI